MNRLILAALITLSLLSISAETVKPPPPVYLVYANGFMGNADAIAKLGILKQAGMTTLLSGSWGYTDVVAIITAIRTEPNLKGYKLIIAIDGAIWTPWNNCIHDPACNLKTYLPQDLKDFLASIVALAKANPDIVTGYYTFDEPALQKRDDVPSVKGVDKEYQQNVYNFIRALDPDKAARPIFIANTMWSLTDADVDRTMSATVQDVILIDQYSFDATQQTQWMRMWKAHNLLTVPYAFVLPAYGDTTCPAYDLAGLRVTLTNVMRQVYKHSLPTVYGVGYFAFWPDPKPGFSYAIDNCVALMDATKASLR